MKTFREKEFIEQLREAEQHTTLDVAMAKHPWAQTAYDHLVRCGTPPDERMWDNPNIPIIDLMSDEEIESRLEQYYRGCGPRYTRETYESDIMFEIRSNISCKSPLTENILFLSQIGRLPKRYEHIIRGAR